MDIATQLQRVRSLEKLQANYKTYTRTIREALFAFNTREEPRYHERIFQNLLQRNYYSIKAVDSLFDLYANDQNFKFPICIQIRSALLDAITIVYLAHYAQKDSDAPFKQQVARLNVLLAKEMKRQFDEMHTNENAPEETLKKMVSYFPENFVVSDNGGISIDKSITGLTPKYMCEEIKKSPHPNLRWFGDCYATYKRFSQYEHFSSFSKEMLDFQKELEFDFILFASYFTVYGSYIALLLLHDDNSRAETIKSIYESIKPEDLTYQFKTE